MSEMSICQFDCLLDVGSKSLNMLNHRLKLFQLALVSGEKCSQTSDPFQIFPSIIRSDLRQWLLSQT